MTRIEAIEMMERLLYCREKEIEWHNGNKDQDRYLMAIKIAINDIRHRVEKEESCK